MSIAVLGAGIQGACVALELARRGYRVDLLDKNAVPVSQASLHNEGKIHLGFVYANDPSLRTATQMLTGSLRFASLLKRWCDLKDLHDHLSSPFFYLVHGQSLLRPALITQHFAQVKDLYLQMTAGTGHRYLDLPNSFVFEQLDRAKTFFDTPKVTAAYRTLEHAIDPAWIARLLRDALLGDPKVTWYENTVVESANLGDDGRVHVTFRRNTDPSRQAYDHVVNCLWDGRVRIDQSFGLGPPAEWLYRFKLAITLQLVRRHGSLASATILLGPFGDVVNFANKSKLYLSWYPHCMLGMSQHPLPPNWWSDLSDPQIAAMLPQTLSALSFIHAGLRSISPQDIRSDRIGGGVICARGKTDISDPASGLHTRFDIGITSRGNYHSVDTGKYCMAPYFALQVARRIAGDD